MYQDLLEKLAQYFSEKDFSKAFLKAKNEYFQKVGKIDQDDPFFNKKMSAFIEWYLFDRLLDDKKIAPVQWYMSLNLANPIEYELLDALSHSCRSLFFVKNIKKKCLKDLIFDKGKKYFVNGEAVCEFDLQGIERKQVIDARLFTYNDKTQITDSYKSYSTHASELLIKEIKKQKNNESQGLDLVLDCAFLEARSRQYTHIKLENIYSLENLKNIRKVG